MRIPCHQGNDARPRGRAAILRDLPSPTAVLSTKRLESPALNLYRTRGWVALGEPLRFPGNPTEYLVLGKRL